MSSPSHGLPPNFSSAIFPRVRFFMPPQQVTLQPFHGAQSPHTQSTGQFCGLQPSFSPSMDSGQVLPSPSASTSTMRERVWRPEPQVAVQGDQTDQGDTSQSTQALEQFTTLEASPQAWPPAKGSTTTLRLLVCVPWQKGVQSVQSLQSSISQSTGQVMSAHARVTEELPSQALPPPAFCTSTSRARVWVAPPQLTGHSDHATQLPHLQSTHSLVQFCTSAMLPQATPPLAGCCVMVRVLLMVPLQYGKQSVHSAQSLYLQSTGQSWLLHSSDWLMSPVQGLPSPISFFM
mmetsp:Transcript_24543/g.58219  ORF Transcript_24543/g.58219 Transcript_24543/m.58219 type:complete len:290 (+) Transcript_24543:1320-2189(+)